MEKAAAEFARTAHSADMLDSLCKKCRFQSRNEYFKKWKALPDSRRKRSVYRRFRYHRTDDGEKARLRSRERKRMIRQEMLNAYGRKCTCCGESHEEFLTLEHINGDGKDHRRIVKKGVYDDLRRRGWPQEGFTILCWNCNMGVRFGEKCPHTQDAIGYGICGA